MADRAPLLNWISGFDALVLDMDETLVRSSPLWERAERELCAGLGIEYSAALAQEYKGKSALDVGAFLWHHRCEGDGTAAEAGARLRAALIQEFAAGVEAMPGADALVRARLTRVQAIASGSPLEAVTAAVRHLGWGGSLEILVSSEEVAQGKPAPDVFVEAARRLGVMPERVLVVEDSLWGVRAARAAGMSCLAVPSSPDPRIAAEADQGLTSLDLLFG